MERRTLAGLCLFFLFLMAAQDTVVQTEAALCDVLSGTFKGACISGNKCSNTCKSKEGAEGGDCQFFQCYCHKNCPPSA